MPRDFRNAPQSTPTQRPLPPEGLATARIFYVVDLGVQKEEFHDPKSKKISISHKSKIKLGFEFPSLIMPKEEGKPDNRCFAIFKEHTWSMNERSKFPPFCQAIFGPRFKVIEETHKGKTVRVGQLDGREFVFGDLLGVYLKASIAHTQPNENGIKYANIVSVSEFPEPMPDDPPRFQRPAPRNPDVLFDLENYDPKVFDVLYKWDQEKIRLSEEWEEMHKDDQPPVDDKQDDLPF